MAILRDLRRFTGGDYSTMGDNVRLMFNGDELFTLEMALTAYQQILEQYDDAETALGGEYGRAGRLLQRVLKAAGRIDG